MSSRAERVARNESTTREINEQIEQAHEAAPVEGHVRVLCECGREDCDRLIAMTLAEYESLRADPRQFAVARDHVLARLRSRTCTLRRVPDQSAVIRISSSGLSPAWRTLLDTSSETATWASKASGSGSASLLRARRALAGA